MEEVIKSTIANLKAKATEFGGRDKDDYVFRENVELNGTDDRKGRYFGFISPDEPKSGVYHDFSLVVFPAYESAQKWLVALGVGSQGFRNDLQMASRPGTRRQFQKIVGNEGFIKADFTNLNSSLNGLKKSSELQHLKDSINMYANVLQAAAAIDPETDKGRKILEAFLATYANIRNWRSNKSHDRAIDEAISPFLLNGKDDLIEIKNLLDSRMFVVIQGAPGTGKTFTAKQIAQKWNYKVFFTQFHSETTYSDFIYGIRPSLDSSEIRYSEFKGEFVKAIEYAELNPTEKILLIIDEINRANLSSVLGPIFYLFEYQETGRNLQLQLYPGKVISEIPKNLSVIATMNTADRSLAVVDFALRRRFAWYTLKPKLLDLKEFRKEEFLRIATIFEEYANHQELNLQPGPAYFIASKDEIPNRIRYELYPLIQEYLDEGLLLDARDEFNTFFIETIGKPLFE